MTMSLVTNRLYIHNIYYTFALGASEGTQMNVASSCNQSQTSSSVEGIHAYILHCTCVCHRVETNI